MAAALGEYASLRELWPETGLAEVTKVGTTRGGAVHAYAARLLVIPEDGAAAGGG